MLTSIGAILDGAPAGPAPQPVRRGSHRAGRCEALFWRSTSRQEIRRICLAARRYDLLGRRAGRRNGPLGHIALEILELLANIVSFKSGRLEPSVAYLMEKLHRSKSAIRDALNALRAHGFLDWMRRYEPTGREGRGPQLRQTSNAYRLSLPARALRLLGIQGRGVPLPDDLEQDRYVRREGITTIKASLPLAELAVIEIDDGPLGRALASLARNVQERGAASQSESQTTISY